MKGSDSLLLKDYDYFRFMVNLHILHKTAPLNNQYCKISFHLATEKNYFDLTILQPPLPCYLSSFESYFNWLHFCNYFTGGYVKLPLYAIALSIAAVVDTNSLCFHLLFNHLISRICRFLGAVRCSESANLAPFRGPPSAEFTPCVSWPENWTFYEKLRWRVDCLGRAESCIPQRGASYFENLNKAVKNNNSYLIVEISLLQLMVKSS